MISCEIVLEYGSESVAKAIMDSVKLDNEGYLDSELQGKKLVFRASSEDAMSLSHTINDLLACVKAAENSIL